MLVMLRSESDVSIQNKLFMDCRVALLLAVTESEDRCPSPLVTAGLRLIA
jgi:hypothetical protein